MTNFLAKRGKAVFNIFEQFDHQKQLKGQAKIVSDGHESIYWINKVIYMCFDGNFLFWWKFFFRKRLNFEIISFWFFKGRRSGLKGLSYTELSYSHAPVKKSWFHPIEFSKLNFKKPRLHCPAFFLRQKNNKIFDPPTLLRGGKSRVSAH